MLKIIVSSVCCKVVRLRGFWSIRGPVSIENTGNYLLSIELLRHKEAF